MHNEILQWVVQLGLFACIPFFALFGIWVWGIKKGTLEPDRLLLALPFVGHSLLEHPFYSSVPHLLAFTSILAISVKGPKVKRMLNKRLTMIMLPINAGISLIVIFFMLASLSSLKALSIYFESTEKDITRLNEVSPTIPFTHHFAIEKFEWKLEKAMKTGEFDRDLILNFINWAEDEKVYFPINKMYLRLAQTYIISNNLVLAEDILDETLLMFPEDEQAIEAAMKMKNYIQSRK